MVVAPVGCQGLLFPWIQCYAYEIDKKAQKLA